MHPPTNDTNVCCTSLQTCGIAFWARSHLGRAYNASNFMASVGGAGRHLVHYTLWSTNRHFGHRCRELPGAVCPNRKCSPSTPVQAENQQTCRSNCALAQRFPHSSWWSKCFSWQRRACRASITASCRMQHTIARWTAHGRAFSSASSSSVSVSSKSSYC